MSNKKIKIGIVSRIHGINYGANLQAIALQHALEKNNFLVEYINYKVDVPVVGLKLILSLAYKFIRIFLGYNKRKSRTIKFRNKYLSRTKTVKNYQELSEIETSFDILMSGSDQIWNPRYFWTSKGYYLLSFANNCNKISYGSSFGIKSLPKDVVDIYKTELSKFKKLSVREIDGKNILKQLGLNSTLVIDPTFLLTPKEWLEYFNPIPQYDFKYICCYVMPGASDLNKYIYTLAEHLCESSHKKYKIIVIGEKEYYGLFSKNRLHINNAGPQDFLNILYNADYILTSSFHGTCFSIIFRKSFYSILDPQNQFNIRIEDLLSSIKLNERIIYSESNLPSLEPLNYSDKEPLIQERILLSYEFINEIATLCNMRN